MLGSPPCVANVATQRTNQQRLAVVSRNICTARRQRRLLLVAVSSLDLCWSALGLCCASLQSDLLVCKSFLMLLSTFFSNDVIVNFCRDLMVCMQLSGLTVTPESQSSWLIDGVTWGATLSHPVQLCLLKTGLKATTFHHCFLHAYNPTDQPSCLIDGCNLVCGTEATSPVERLETGALMHAKRRTRNANANTV